MQPKSKRPTGVTVLAVLDILGGIFGIVAGPLVFGVNALGVLSLILGIVSLVTAIGFLGGRGWAWTLGIAVSVINIIVTIGESAIGYSSYSSSIVTIIFAIIIIYYLMRPHVKAFFGKGPAMAAGMQPPPMMSSSTPMGSAPTGSMGMTCKNCGASIPAGATRCPSCGANL